MRVSRKDFEAVSAAADFINTSLYAADDDKNYKYYVKITRDLRALQEKLKKSLTTKNEG